MPWVMQMTGCALAIIGIALAVWIGFWLILVMAMLSVFVALWRYLVKKGIVHAPSGAFHPIITVEQDASSIDHGVTHIEGQYERVDDTTNSHDESR
jgi:hypothetical protein